MSILCLIGLFLIFRTVTDVLGFGCWARRSGFGRGTLVLFLLFVMHFCLLFSAATIQEALIFNASIYSIDFVV